MKQEIKERVEKIRKGEVPEGYKATKVGIIPDDWGVKKIENVSPLQRGFDLPSNELKNGDYPVVYSNGIVNYHYSYKVKAPGVVTGRSGTIGKVTFVEVNYWPHNTSLWVTDFKGNDPKFIYYLYLKMKLERFGAGSGVPTLNRNDVHSFKIPLPHLPEQKKIAEILSTWDTAIELKEKLIEEKREFKRGLMQNLLAGEIRYPKFSGEWEEKKLGDIFSERKEINQNESELLSITSSRGVIKRSEIEGKDNSSKDKSKYKKICRGDIGYNTMRMWQGVSAVSEYEGIVSPAYTIVKIKEDGDIYYFGYLFKLRKIIDLFWRYSQGLVNDTLNLKYENFKIIKITVPTSKLEQEKISATLKSIDTEISLIKAEKELLEKQKRGLMQLLLTGIVRVEVD